MPVTPAPGSGLSPAQVNVMRKVATDPAFRTSFFKDPTKATSQANLVISKNELTPLTKITPHQYDSLQHFVGATVTNAADGTHTVAYAVALAVAFALAFANTATGAAGVE